MSRNWRSDFPEYAIHREPVSSRLLYLQEMDVNRMRDDVKTEALAAGECC